MMDDILEEADDPDATCPTMPACAPFDQGRLTRSSTRRLLAMARAADQELGRTDAVGNGDSGDCQPARCRAELLLAIYAIVNRRLARAPLDPRTFLPIVEGITWDATSPAAGDIADVPPFANAPRWAALALGLTAPLG